MAPDKGESVALVKGVLSKEWLGSMKAEERSKLLRGLMAERVVTNDVEDLWLVRWVSGIVVGWGLLEM
jgi:hypothetical protein